MDVLKKSRADQGRGKLLDPVREMVHSFLYSSKEVTADPVHIRSGMDTKRLMFIVLVALMPSILLGVYNIGFQNIKALGMPLNHFLAFLYGLRVFLPLLGVTLLVGGLWELLFAIINKREVTDGFLVTAVLFCLIVPPTLPMWQAALAITFGVVVGKELFGGAGKNILNPALVARLVITLFSPATMLGDRIWVYTDPQNSTFFSSLARSLFDAFTNATPSVHDAVSMATPLGLPSKDLGERIVQVLHSYDYSWIQCFLGTIPGSIGETSAFACLIGAIILLWKRVASWRTMIGCFFGGVMVSLLFYLLPNKAPAAMESIPPHFHMVFGGFTFGMVFMATDPVTSPFGARAKLIYGLLIGALAMAIRIKSPFYPEGMMFAILLMNCTVPLFNHISKKSLIRRREQARSKSFQ